MVSVVMREIDLLMAGKLDDKDPRSPLQGWISFI